MRQEVPGKERDILTTLPHRRQPDPNDVESVIQILPEASLAYPGIKVLVGRRNHPDIRPDLLVSTDAVKAAV